MVPGDRTRSRSRARSKTPGPVEGTGVQTFKPLPSKNNPERIKAYKEKKVINAYDLQQQAGYVGADTANTNNTSPLQSVFENNTPRYYQTPRTNTLSNSNVRMVARTQSFQSYQHSERSSSGMHDNTFATTSKRNTISRNRPIDPRQHRNETRTPTGEQQQQNIIQSFKNQCATSGQAVIDHSYFGDNAWINHDNNYNSESVDDQDEYNQGDIPPQTMQAQSYRRIPAQESMTKNGKRRMERSRSRETVKINRSNDVNRNQEAPCTSTASSNEIGFALSPDVLNFFQQQAELAIRIDNIDRRVKLVEKTQNLLSAFVGEIYE